MVHFTLASQIIFSEDSVNMLLEKVAITQNETDLKKCFTMKPSTPELPLKKEKSR